MELAVTPTYYSPNIPVSVALVILGTLFLVAGFYLLFRNDNFVLLAVGCVIGGPLLFLGSAGLSNVNVVDTETTLRDVVDTYEIAAEEDAKLPDLTVSHSFSTFDFIKSSNNEVHDDARLVWDGEELTLLVKDKVAEEYVAYEPAE